MRNLEMITKLLLIIGGLNWGLYGILNIDLVAYACGAETILAKVVYGLVGASALVQLIQCRCLGGQCHSHKSECHTSKHDGGGCCR